MPFEPTSPLGGFTGVAEPEAPQSFTDLNPETRPFQPQQPGLWGAAFRTENTIGSSIASEEVRTAREQQGIFGGPVKIDPDFDPWAEIADTPYEPYYEQFALAGNKQHFEAIKADIDRENKDRNVIAQSGWAGIGASMAAGTLDLPILIPGGAIMRTTAGGVSLLKTAAVTAAAGGVAGGASELALQGTQQLRTAEESAMVIGGSVILSGLLGAGFGKLFSRAEQAALAARVEQDFSVPGLSERDPFEPGGVRVEAAPGASDRATQVADAIRETAEQILPPSVRVQVADSIDIAGGGKFGLRGFYSPAIRAAEDIRQEKGTGEQFWKQITKVGGVRKDELEWMGLEEFLADKKSITKAEVLEFMRAHQVELDEVILEQSARPKSAINEIDPDGVLMDEDLLEFNLLPDEAAEALRQTTKFEGHKVSGGTNYRELLIRLPELARTVDPAAQHRMAEIQSRIDELVQSDFLTGRETVRSGFEDEVNSLRAEYNSMLLKGGDTPRYVSKHFEDQEIVHLRVDDRTGPNGEKVLFVNEVQSDLHQKGRTTSYGLSEDQRFERRRAIDKELDEVEFRLAHAQAGGNYSSERAVELRKQKEQLRNQRQALSEEGVPDAPFKGDLWLELALKRALLYASENGYDAVSWARSDQIAKAVGAEPEKLALQYDQKIGKFLDKYTRKWGGKVEQADLGIKKLDPQDGFGQDGLFEEFNGDVGAALRAFNESPHRFVVSESEIEPTRRWLEMLNSATEENPVLRITPEMRASVLEGQPLGLRRGAGGERVAEGRFDPENLLITISADALDPVKTLKHESIHALRSAGLFNPKEWATLENAARKQGWVETTNVRQTYEGVYSQGGRTEKELSDLLTEEAIAEQFSLWRQGAIQVTGAVQKLFQRIKNFLDQIGNALRGRGFQTADDVFAAVESGRVKLRAEAALPGLPGAPALSTGAARSVGAAARDPVDNTLKGAFGLERGAAFMVPELRLFNSPSNVTKRYSQELYETALAFEKNRAGNETAPLGTELGAPGAVETRVKFWQAPLAEATQAVDDAFLKYRKGRQKRMIGELSALTLRDTIFGTQALTYRGFKEEISKALRRGDAHEIPEVAQAAKTIRTKVLDPLKDEAIAAKLLPEDIDPETAPSYLNRIYNRERIIAERDQFKAVIRNWLEGVEDNNAAVRARLSTALAALKSEQEGIKRTEAKIGRRKESGKEADIEGLQAEIAEANLRIKDLQKQIEDEVVKYQGKSAKEAQRAVDQRTEAEAARDPDAPQLKAADKPVLQAARKIARQLDKEPAELDDLADQIIDRIIGTPDGRLPYDAHMDTVNKGGVSSQVRGPLAARVFMIPDRMIEPWLENDIEQLMRAYVRTMAPDVELTKRFGSADMTLQMKEIQDDYARRSAAATTPEQRKKINAQKNADIRDLAAVRDRLRGTYAIPSNPDAIMVRAGRVIGAWNLLRMLGGMTVSAIPDLARPIMVHGMMRTFGGGLFPLLANWSSAKLAMKEVKLAGTALDMVLDSRAMRIANVMNEFGRHTKFERAVHAGARNFGIVSLMAPWNAAAKQFAGLITMTRILEATDALAKGKIKPKELEALAAGGISELNAKKIAEQMKKHGVKQGGVWLPNTHVWDADARAAKEAFRAALVRDVDRIVVTPGIADRPLWMSHELGRLVGQFKSFAIASMQKTVISGLQQSDGSVLAGAALMVALGGLVHVIKARGGDHDPGIPKQWGMNQETSQFMVNAVDRSGLTGWLMEANNITEKVTRGAVGLSALTGKQVGRYASRNVTASMLGPSLGTVEDFVRVTGAAIEGDWTQSDSRVMKRLIPYNNLFYLRSAFDKAQAGLDSYFGVPERARR